MNSTCFWSQDISLFNSITFGKTVGDEIILNEQPVMAVPAANAGVDDFV
jgi:hypothetical protein